MFKAFATLVLALVFAMPAAANDWSTAIKQAEKSIVYIESEEGSCTGFVVDTVRKYVLTAAHCDGEKLWVDRVAGKVVSKDTKKDLMILKVEELDPSKEALQFAAVEPEIGQEVVSAGYGYGLERPFFRKSMVSDNKLMLSAEGLPGPYVAVDSGYIGGQSGGPVVDQDGNVVSIVQMASDKLGIGVNAAIIKERMGRFLAVPVAKRD
jgi:S1-C subfamily serine protease